MDKLLLLHDLQPTYQHGVSGTGPAGSWVLYPQQGSVVPAGKSSSWEHFLVTVAGEAS